jgi:hypothetical protein
MPQWRRDCAILAKVTSEINVQSMIRATTHSTWRICFQLPLWVDTRPKAHTQQSRIKPRCKMQRHTQFAVF